MVNATSDFERHPYVINGCSELFAEIGTGKRRRRAEVQWVWAPYLTTYFLSKSRPVLLK
ncbi:MAG: hypothetical protein R2788_25300 [Saprospiraceae bacterium]